MQSLIVFDIDGTLTDTFQTDYALFEKSIIETIPAIKIIRDLHAYKYSTDSGFLLEIFQDNFTRSPHEHEIQSIKNTFLKYLVAAFTDNYSCCLPIPGASDIFAKIKANAEQWDIAIATGCWEKSALLKLGTAKIPFQFLPIAHADDSIHRTEIIKMAIQRAKTIYKRQRYTRIVYVGDRLWDKIAAAELGIDFVGIGAAFVNMEQQPALCIQDYRTDALLTYLL